MNDLDRALDDLQHIRATLAQNHEFRGFGDKMLFATGCSALVLGIWQLIRVPHPSKIIWEWIILGVIVLAFLGVEVFRKARFEHKGSAQSRMLNVLNAYFPSFLLAGFLSLAIVLRGDFYYWLLPSVWLGSIGVATYAAAPKLPRGMKWVAMWYLTVAIISLNTSDDPQSFVLVLTIAFALGQWLSAWFHMEKGKS